MSDEYQFAAVSGSKVRWSFENCQRQMFPGGDYHGWLYEFEVFGL